MRPTLLADPQIVEITGADAVSFAQAQFASDLTRLSDGDWQFSAWLSAPGRVRAFFQLIRLGDERLLLVLRGGSATTFRDALKRYVLRAKVSLDALSGARLIVAVDRAEVGGSSTASTRHVGIEAGVFRLHMMGNPPRTLTLVTDPSAAIEADSSRETRNSAALADINAGLPAFDDALGDMLLPDALGLRELGAVSVNKGCYPGQEIVARLHFKGGNKRWLHRVDFRSAHLPTAGATLDLGGTENGIFLNAAWDGHGAGRALAALRDSPALVLPASTREGMIVERIVRVQQ